jgi:aryl-alcohol dehydrogenase-like predicted oxidoreductase
MDYVNLGNTGLKVSRICLGCMTYGAPATSDPKPGSHYWALGEEESRPFLRQALDVGINFFDTANVYSLGESESVLGRFFKANARREELVIATKLNGVMRDDPNGRGQSRKEIFFELDQSLRRLQTDYVDLYQIHRWDYDTPIEETLDALNDVVRSGKVRYIGASSMHAWQFTKALYLSRMHGWARFVSMQNHYNLLYREEEREMIPLCQSEGIGVIPWSPLARGRLARPAQGAESTKRNETDQVTKRMYAKTEEADAKVIDRVGQVAAQRSVPPAQVALAWMLGKPAITAPIVGATKPNHITDAVAALSLHLTPEEISSLEEPYIPHSVLGFR